MPIPEAVLRRRHQTSDINQLCKRILRLLDDLTVDPDKITHAPSSQGVVLRSDRGTLIGKLHHPDLVTLLTNSRGWLKTLIVYVRQLESEAYDNRDAHRRARAVMRYLYDAERAGLGTKHGNQLIRAAIDADQDDRRGHAGRFR